ncbi:MAG: hypothetical protein RL095_2791 [Verrucomicrobiota bacterium]|jgi:hypothetical protein
MAMDDAQQPDFVKAGAPEKILESQKCIFESGVSVFQIDIEDPRPSRRHIEGLAAHQTFAQAEIALAATTAPLFSFAW